MLTGARIRADMPENQYKAPVKIREKKQNASTQDKYYIILADSFTIVRSYHPLPG